MSSFFSSSPHHHFCKEALSAHNHYRAKHGSAPLKHCSHLEKSAQEWAEKLLQKPKLEQSALSTKGDVGENITARTSSAKFADFSGQEVTDQWYSDITHYDFDTGEGDAGNFTQLVWQASTAVGFGKAHKDGRVIVVAHYRPPGNVQHQYTQNVKRATAGGKNQLSPGGGGKPERPRSVSPATARAMAAEGGGGGSGRESPVASTKVTTVTETKVGPGGERFLVRKETTQKTDALGRVTEQVKEFRIEDDEESKRKSKTGETSDDDLGGGSASADQKKHDKALKKFVTDVVAAHNVYRKQHGAPKLKCSKDLDTMAQKWAEHLADEPELSNSNSTYKGDRLGENIASRWSNGPCDYGAQEVVDHWYAEIKNYDFGTEPSDVKGKGNFTQMVWRNSKEIGVGKATSGSVNSGNRVIAVCYYHPAGNVLRCFKDNVHSPTSK